MGVCLMVWIKVIGLKSTAKMLVFLKVASKNWKFTLPVMVYVKVPTCNIFQGQLEENEIENMHLGRVTKNK